MRKISKSRADDDVISSTNGSVVNDEQADTDAPSPTPNDTKDQEADSEGNRSVDEHEKSDSSEPPKKSKAHKSKSKKRKSEKAEKDDDAEEEYEENEEADHLAKLAMSEGDIKSRCYQKWKDNFDKRSMKKVEKVIDSKKIKGKLHYLIRWKGYSANSDTWEPENTLSCPDLISKYHEEKENSKNKEGKSSKKSMKRKAKKSPSKPSKKPKTSWDENADDNAEYEVDRILEVHHKKNGKREFLIHWKGWSTKFDSWEPENNLNCPELIKRFMDKVGAARATESRNLRVAPETTNRFTLQDPSSGRRLSKRRGQRQRVRYDNAE